MIDGGGARPPTGVRPRVLVFDTNADRRQLLAVALNFMDMHVEIATGCVDAMDRTRRLSPHTIVVGHSGIGEADMVDAARFVDQLHLLGPTSEVLLLADPSTRGVPAQRRIPHRWNAARIVEAGLDDLQVISDAVQRSVGRLRPPAAGHRLELAVEGLVLEDHDRTVRIGDCRAPLTPTEGRLLRLLMVNVDIVVSKVAIVEAVWGYSGSTNVVETYVSYLRRKLAEIGAPRIHTVRGAGYVLRSR